MRSRKEIMENDGANHNNNNKKNGKGKKSFILNKGENEQKKQNRCKFFFQIPHSNRNKREVKLKT